MITFDDNARIILICGKNDAVLGYLEDTLHVTIQLRGNVFSFNGGKNECKRAGEALTYLYAHTKEQLCNVSDAMTAIRMTQDQDSQFAYKSIHTKQKIVKSRSINQSKYIDLMQNKAIVFGLGAAGTGKTYLAVASAAAMLEKNMVDRIVLVRPAVEAGENLGFLPGDMHEKVDPYLQPLLNALNEILGAQYVMKAFENNLIEVAPLAFMRGRTLSHSFIILDEAQNATREQLKMFLTRFGNGSKMVINGDPSQSDLKHNKNALTEVVNIVSNIPDIGIVKFVYGDVVRHHLVGQILHAFENDNTCDKS